MAKKDRKHDTAEQLRLKEIIRQAKRLRTYPGIVWDDFRWDITQFEKYGAHRTPTLNLYFSARRASKGSPHIPYKPPFSDFAKAIIRTRASERALTYDGHAHMVIALRYLYAALEQTGDTDPTRLIRKHFVNAVTLARKASKGWTLVHVGRSLGQISKWMDDLQLTKTRLSFANPISCLGNGDGLDPHSQALGLLKMPSAAALESLADISNNPLDDNECILLRIIDLLAIGGFRIGEVLGLSLDCWVETPATNDIGEIKTDPISKRPLLRYGIRYWPEKGGEPYVKWLSDIAVPVARRAVKDLTRLCADARAGAKILEDNPDRVPLRGDLNQDELIDLNQLTLTLGLRTVESTRTLLTSLQIKPASVRKPNGRPYWLFRIKEVEKGLRKRCRRTVIVTRQGGQVQMLSQSLCVMFRNQFHARRGTLRFLCQLITESQINDALGNRAVASIFSVRGLTEFDGSPMRIKTNAFRHWLNTLLSRGGLSDVELARWSGRRNIDQNGAYKHGTVEQRVSWARNMIKEGTLRGPAADTYNSINDPVEKEQFLETFVNVALFTPYGVCIHDYAIDPCPYHLNCLGGCSEYLRTQGDTDEQKNIEAVRAFHLVQLQRIKTTTQNVAGTVRNYEAHCERIVQGTTAALAVDDDTIPDGQLVKVFPNGKARGKAFTNL